MMIRVNLLCCIAVVTLLCATRSARAADSVTVIAAKNAPPIEQFAARELSAQFKRLFDVKVVLADKEPADAGPLIFLGSPPTNPAVKALLGDKWPEVSDQGIVLLSVGHKGKQALVVGGGSPVATLWAVYELGYRHGIRYLLREDIYPNTPIPLKLGGFNVVDEPELRTRTWRTINDFPIGPESWPLTDHKRLLGQLAKQKFNRVMLSVYPWQPFVHYEFGGVKKQTAMLWYGERFTIARDAPGRTALGGARVFENPDFAGLKTYEEMTVAGVKHARGIIDEAHRLGMSVGLSIQPVEFPREFARVLPGAKDVHQLKNLTIGPGPKQKPEDQLLRRLVAAKIRAYIETYPTVDALYVGMPEFPEWEEHAEAAWRTLSEGGRLDGFTLEGLIQAASKRNLISSGKRGEQAVKGNVVGLAFFKSLFADSELLKRPDGHGVALVIRGVDPALYPVLDQVVPEGASTLNFIDYTARRVVENRKLLSQIPAGKVRSGLILTLADDNVGVLSQSATNSIHELLGDIRQGGWDGFSTRYWMLAELDPTVHYISRAAWDPKVTPRSCHDELFTAITGKPSTADRLWLGFQQIEKATELIDRHDIGFGFPVAGMFMKHYEAKPAPKWLDEMNECYTQAMVELYRSNSNTDPRAQRILFYWAKRSEYVLEYLAAVKSVREAAIARKNGENEKAIEHFETAIEQLYNAIDTLSDVARDQSDRGLIAVLNAYAYIPLMAEYEKALEDE